jgi:hypothetical protein
MLYSINYTHKHLESQYVYFSPYIPSYSEELAYHHAFYICVRVPAYVPYTTLEILTVFRETWYERYATGGVQPHAVSVSDNQ